MMTREEKIEKLNTVSVLVTDLTVTFDMGLEFTTMTSKGVTTQMGNIGQWPCFVFNMTKQIRNLLDKLHTGEEVSNELFLSTPLGATLTTHHDFYNGDSHFYENKASQILSILREKIQNVKNIGDRLYVYASPEEWNMKFGFFATMDELTDFFIKSWGSDEELYENMTDEEIDDYYIKAKEEDFFSLPYQAIGFEDEVE